MVFKYKNENYNITRYPKSVNRSLKPWSAADEYILKYIGEMDLNFKSLAIFNDRFGFLSCILSELSPITTIDHNSQQKAIFNNAKLNKLNIPNSQWYSSLEPLPNTIKTGIIKIPKSLELFSLYLYQLSQCLDKELFVICSFMTRHFTPQIIKIAEEFFEQVEQSRAWKKSRLLILRKKKPFKERAILNSIKFDDQYILRQYFGVFSSKNIDPASRFLIDHLNINPEDRRVLDMASGNGILAYIIRSQNPEAEIHLLDNSFLAIESSKLNLNKENTYFHYKDNLEDFDSEYFDLVVSNPPFHFEYEINIEISLGLFKETHRCLKTNGQFQLVANQHLNYKVHIEKIFREVKIIAENVKFIIYECIK